MSRGPTTADPPPATRTDLLTSLPPSRRRAMVIWEGGMTSAEVRDGETTIGRSREAGLFVDHGSVSRRHAVLCLAGSALHIQDLGSANGTFVAGARIPAGAPVPLAFGAAVKVGAASLVVLDGSSAAPETHRPSSEAGAPASVSAGNFVMVVADPRMRDVLRLVEVAASASMTVLLTGETGVGKEVVADAIHALSPRAARPLVRVNCAALPEALFESELFGHEKGAFTGATSAKPGLLEAADGGTVFLDEIGEMPLLIQAKVLRALETREFGRVGSLRPRRVDVRFVAATNRDLQAEVEAGRFRRDLFFRLHGLSIVIPPLRERPGEIVPLAGAFLDRIALRLGLATPALGPSALARLLAHDWPGNVRELRNVVECAVSLSQGRTIEAEHLLLPASSPAPTPLAAPLSDDLRALERRRIIEALEACGGNQTEAARRLGIPRRTFLTRLDQYGIQRPRKGG